MAKKKQQKKQEVQTAQQETKQRNRFAIFGTILATVGIALMFYDSKFYGVAPEKYSLLMDLSYMMVTFCGVCFVLGSRDVADASKKTRMEIMGIVFIIIAGGRLITNFIKAMLF